MKKRESVGVINKYTGIPHLQIGLVRDVIYKLISFMQGTYKVYTKGNKVNFEIKLPMNQGKYTHNSWRIPNEPPISPWRSEENGKQFCL